MYRRLVEYVIISLLCVGCSSKNDDDIILPAETSYRNGLSLLKEGEYRKAADAFDKTYLDNQGDPLSAYAELMEGYSLYQGSEYEEATDVLDAFIEMHPGHEDIAYAHYLKSLCYYMQVGDVHIDQTPALNAKVAFESIMTRFPHTKYATDVSMKMDLVNDHLAAKEMLIGRYYLRKKSPVPAIKRFQTVIKQYETTPQTPEALYRIAEGFKMIGLESEVQKYLSVLVYNFPDNKWAKAGMDLQKRNNE